MQENVAVVRICLTESKLAPLQKHFFVGRFLRKIKNLSVYIFAKDIFAAYDFIWNHSVNQRTMIVNSTN